MSTTAAQTHLPTSHADANAVMRARGIRRSFRMGDSTIEVLKKVDLTIRSGEFIAIEGRSGSGKSTLLHILGGLDAVDGGTVEFDGRDYTRATVLPRSRRLLRPLSNWCWRLALAFAFAWIFCMVPVVLERWETVGRFQQPFQFAVIGFGAAWVALLIARAVLHHRSESPITRLRNEKFGFVFQFYHLLPELNVLENTLLASMIDQPTLGFLASKKALRSRAKEVLKQLGMDHRLKHRPNQLSGGERQRVAIARALMNNPRVLFADEPTGNLDFETGRQIMAVLENLHQNHGQTIIMVTHDRALARQADRVLVLREGMLEKAENGQ
jgi:lipoprotein-releasing system ATP-binding protein